MKLHQLIIAIKTFTSTFYPFHAFILHSSFRACFISHLSLKMCPFIWLRIHHVISKLLLLLPQKCGSLGGYGFLNKILFKSFLSHKLKFWGNNAWYVRYLIHISTLDAFNFISNDFQFDGIPTNEYLIGNVQLNL